MQKYGQDCALVEHTKYAAGVAFYGALLLSPSSSDYCRGDTILPTREDQLVAWVTSRWLRLCMVCLCYLIQTMAPVLDADCRSMDSIVFVRWMS